MSELLPQGKLAQIGAQRKLPLSFKGAIFPALSAK